MTTSCPTRGMNCVAPGLSRPHLGDADRAGDLGGVPVPVKLDEDAALLVDVDLLAPALLAGDDDAGLGAADMRPGRDGRRAERPVALQELVVAAIDLAGPEP